MEKYLASLSNRDSVELSLEAAGSIKTLSGLQGVGCHKFLSLIKEWRQHLKSDIKTVPLPKGEDHSAMLLREVIMKAKGEWSYPYKEEEMCHCRSIPAAIVDGAIVSGCHTVEKVGIETSAGTACGTCREDILKSIAYRKAN